MEKKITDFISGEVTYDRDGQYFWIDGSQMLAELRGWGRIQNMFPMSEEGQLAAGVFQDEIGQFIADAINEKLKPVEVPAVDAEKLAIGFAEWMDIDCIGNVNIIGTEWHEKYKLADKEWLYFGGENIDPEIKTTPDLLTMYLNEKQKG